MQVANGKVRYVAIAILEERLFCCSIPVLKMMSQ